MNAPDDRSDPIVWGFACFDDGADKSVGIFRTTGRRPMLQ
jgi:hypothetical protein